MVRGNIATRRTALASVAALIISGPMLASTVNADTTSGQQVKAVQKVYLRSTPRIARNTIVREDAGTQFTVIDTNSSGWWHVSDQNGQVGYVIDNTNWVVPDFQVPPGVTLDPNLTPLAATDASTQDKFNAILTVAQSKLGTPYLWGHNEDRGQYGFDCSNFTAYVYHHALGYKMSGASQTQFHSVGWDVSSTDMQPGDLLIFNNGGHVGIYIGNGRMIEEGGGLGKVGYLSVAPGSYWGNHLTVVRRMF